MERFISAIMADAEIAGHVVEQQGRGEGVDFALAIDEARVRRGFFERLFWEVEGSPGAGGRARQPQILGISPYRAQMLTEWIKEGHVAVVFHVQRAGVDGLCQALIEHGAWAIEVEHQAGGTAERDEPDRRLFEALERRCRVHFAEAYGRGMAGYEGMRPAYLFGMWLAMQRRPEQEVFEEVRTQARSLWENRRRQSWEGVEEAVDFGWRCVRRQQRRRAQRGARRR